MQLKSTGRFLRGVLVAAIRHVHAIDEALGVGIHDPQQRPRPEVHLRDVPHGRSPLHDIVHHAHLLLLFRLQALGVHVLDAEIVRVCRSVAESDLQRPVQGVEGGVGGTGERAPDWRVGDGVRAEVEFQDVVGAFAVGLVAGPVLLLTFGAWRR